MSAFFETTSTNWTGLGQDDPAAALMIFLLADKCKTVLTGLV
jgi:hypothetical protein